MMKRSSKKKEKKNREKEKLMSSTKWRVFWQEQEIRKKKEKVDQKCTRKPTRFTSTTFLHNEAILGLSAGKPSYWSIAFPSLLRQAEEASPFSRFTSRIRGSHSRQQTSTIDHHLSSTTITTSNLYCESCVVSIADPPFSLMVLSNHMNVTTKVGRTKGQSVVFCIFLLVGRWVMRQRQWSWVSKI